MRGVEPMPRAANGWGRLGRTPLLFLRLYVGCLIATPLVMFSTVILGGLYQGWPNPFDDIGVLLGWSAALFVGALVLGIPIAFATFLFVRNFWLRLVVLVGAGLVVNFVLFAVLFAHPLGGVIAAPAGAITAAACCLLNLREIGKPDPKFV